MLKVTFQPSPLFFLYPLALLFYKASTWRTFSPHTNGLLQCSLPQIVLYQSVATRRHIGVPSIKAIIPTILDTVCGGWSFLLTNDHLFSKGEWKKEWASSHTPRSNIAWECCIQWKGTPSIRDGQSDKKGDINCSSKGSTSISCNKRPTGLNGHLSIRDFSLTSCQKGLYLYINSPIIE